MKKKAFSSFLGSSSNWPIYYCKIAVCIKIPVPARFFADKIGFIFSFPESMWWYGSEFKIGVVWNKEESGVLQFLLLARFPF